MSKYIDAERLKADIEKRLKNTRDYMNGTGMKYKGQKYYKAQGKESAYDAILNVIDSLQQEQPSDDLEEAAEEYRRESYRKSIVPNIDGPMPEYGGNIKDSFKAGAEWQYQKDRREFAKIKAKTWCEGFDAHKEQMLKDAVEGEIAHDRGVDYLDYNIAKLDEYIFSRFKAGDKVKIIIIKEDKK